MDGDALLGRAERVVALARRRGLMAECFLEWGTGLHVELEKGAVSNTGVSEGGGGGVRVVVDGRIGFAYFTDVRKAGEALERAAKASRHGERLDYALPSAPRRRGLARRWDERAAQLDADGAIRLAQDLVCGASETAPKATVSGGGVGMDAEWKAVANTQGTANWERSTMVTAGASLVQEDGAASVSASESAASHRLRVDAHDVGRQAAQTLLDLLRPKAPAAGRKEVMFLPEAGAELVSGILVAAAMGDEARRGKTVWSDQLEKRVAPRDFRLADDSSFPGSVGGASIDGEGLPTRRLPIVEGGILRNFLYDSVDAARHHAVSTHSAERNDFKSRPGTGTHHLVVEGKSRPRPKLIEGMDDGYVVESVLGAHTANATTGDFSVTAPNVWRVRKGDLVGPVREIALGGNLPAMLLRLRAVSAEAKAMDGLRMPALLFDDVAVAT
jgi:PmbA protein